MITDLKFIWRRIFKNKLSSIINMFGLTIGLFVSLLLFNYIIQESTYDHHHANADRIYKVISNIAWSQDEKGVFGISLGSVAEEFQSRFPQVENTTRLYGPHSVELDLESSRLNQVSVLYMDYSFFEVFDFPQITPRVFNSIEHAVISQDFAKKLPFDDPIGERITIEGSSYQITAILDIPHNTTFQYDVALPLVSDPFYESMKNGGLEYETYVLLDENGNNLPTLALLSDHYNTLTKQKWQLYESDNYMLPLKEVYLDTNVSNRMGNGNPQLLTIIFTISILVLGLALINYVNLQIANNHSRIGELRLRKIMGAGKKAILIQGVLESLIVIGISGAFAILFLDLFYASQFSQLLGDGILTIHNWDFTFWSSLIGGLTLAGIVVGIVPAIKLFQLRSLTQELKQKKLGKLTISLVIFQFFVTTALLTTIMFVNHQMEFLRNQSPGYSSEQVVMIDNLNENHNEGYQRIKATLEQQVNILSVAGAQNAPGRGASGQFVHRTDKSPDSGISIAHIRTINGYAKTLDLDFMQGGDFTVTSTGGETQFILNESAASLLFNEGENPIDEVIDMSGRVGKIVGVVKDFHFRSFHHKISPLAINVEQPYDLTLLIKIRPENAASTLAIIEETLSDLDPLYVFDYQFLDEQFAMTYETELRSMSIISYATVIAFSISIMGLLALSIFVINSRIKEIAIRKTLGGSNMHLFNRLSFQLISWIAVANLLSAPISYLVAENWVQSFIYQIELTNLLWMSPLATIATLIVALLVIFRKLYKTMTLNPVEFLRYE